MSKLDTLDEWLDEFRQDHGCVGAWLEYDHFNSYTRNHQRFTYESNEICNAVGSCDNCIFQDPSKVQGKIKEIPDGIVNANPSGPF